MSMLTRTSTMLLNGLRDPSDKTCWEQFDGRYRPLVLAVGRRLGLQEADVEDAAQEAMAAFVQAYRRNQYDRDKGRLRDWLCGIASHKIRDIQRKRSRQEKPVTDKTDAANILNQIEDHRMKTFWEDECKKAILRQSLEEVRREVDPRAFEAFQLFALQQWPATRVAAHLQISEDVVYQNKRRILARVRKILPQMEEIW
jgi:RNA polymerase sigma factor (sigma-70 family)